MTSPKVLRLLGLAMLARGAMGDTLSTIIQSYGLTANNITYPFPSDVMDSSDASSYIVKNWDTSSSHLEFGTNGVVFTADPSTTSSTLVRRADSSTTSSSSSHKFKSSSTATTSTASASGAVTTPFDTNLDGESPVLRVFYPQGSYSKQTGGTQFYSTPLEASGSSSTTGNTTSNGQYERMLISYDIWFPSGFGWNMGGKLPGLRAGAESTGCAGGNQTDGTKCFSTRLMWRSSGEGEVYAYIPTTQKNFCSQSEVTCNSDYGTSLARGSFSFVTGQWQTIWLLVVLNEVGTANGVVELWYNGVQALSFTNLEIRSASSLSSIGGMFFSTFFGGDDSTWASPTDQYTYFKNIQMYAGFGASNGSGSAVSGASPRVPGTSIASAWTWTFIGTFATALGLWTGVW